MMPNLFLVCLMSLGIVASEKPVRSHRPADTADQKKEVAMVENEPSAPVEMLPNVGVANHLWEDPLDLLDTGDKTALPIEAVYQNWIKESSVRDIGDSVQKKLCLVVGLPSGSSSSAVEKRIRIRSAVSSALLAKEGYYYVHGASLQVAEWDYSEKRLNGEEQTQSVPLGYSRLYRPFSDKKSKKSEEAKESGGSKNSEEDQLSEYQFVFLLYVDEGAWGGDFGKQILQLFEDLRFEKPEAKDESGEDGTNGEKDDSDQNPEPEQEEKPKEPTVEEPEKEKPGVDWAYVGLTNSHRLHEFVKESEEIADVTISKDGREQKTSVSEEEKKYQEMVQLKRWEKFRVISPHATIDDEVFADLFWASTVRNIFESPKSEPEPEEKEEIVEQPQLRLTLPGQTSQYASQMQQTAGVDLKGSAFEQEVLKKKAELRIERLMAHDGLLSAALIKELGERHVSPKEKNEDDMEEAVLLLSEMDSFYGRSIAKTFQRKWEEIHPKDKDQDNLVVLHYQLGLDGHQREPAEGPEGAGEGQAAQLELAEGRSQIDSVTRLVRRIRALESMKGIQFKAIGVLGSDVYDKLLLLRALRPEFHEARFFTTDLDARLWQGPERKSARNLIVASSPLFHARNQGKLKAPPFRSHYQLGTYEAILAALYDPNDIRKTEDGDVLCRPSNELGMYEIGKNGPIFLGGYREEIVKDEEGKEKNIMTLVGPAHDELDYPTEGFASSHFALLMTMILLVFLYCCWPHLTPLWRREVFNGQIQREWSLRDRVFCGVYTVSLIYVGALVIRLQVGCTNNFEPVRLMDGVSIWPTVIFNILISMLALCWLIRSWKILDWSHNHLKDCFPFNSGLKVSETLEEVVERFDQGGKLKRRLIRTGGLFVVYFLVYQFLLMELPSQNIENLARGEMAAGFLQTADMISHVFMALLLFFICDAVFHFSRAIHFGMTMVRNGRFDDVVPGIESDEDKEVDPDVRTWNKPGMSQEEAEKISAALENGHPQPYWQTSMLEIGMRRAKTIGSLLYYPFICLFFLFIARNAIFDDFALSERLIWTYLLMFSLLAGAIIYSQYALKRLFQESSAALQTAIQTNPEPVAVYYQDELKLLYAMQKEATYGIFNNPLFKAAIIPIGGSGILEIVSQIAPGLRGG